MTDSTGCLTSSLNVRALVNVSSLFTLYINNHNEPSEPLKSERSADYVSGRLQVSRLCSSADLQDTDEGKTASLWSMIDGSVAYICGVFSTSKSFFVSLAQFSQTGSNSDVMKKNSESLQLLH